MNTELSPAIPLPGSLQKRLYEPAILLSCLTPFSVALNAAENLVIGTGAGHSPRQVYFHFLNKLGQVCDTDRGGGTSTSFAILCPATGGAEYYFASNDRDADALETVKAYIVDLLQTIRDIPEDVVGEVTSESFISGEILKKILRFNRPQIESCAKVLASELDSCIERTDNKDTTKGKLPIPLLLSLPQSCGLNDGLAQRALKNLRVWAIALDSKTPNIDDDECTYLLGLRARHLGREKKHPSLANAIWYPVFQWQGEVKPSCAQSASRVGTPSRISSTARSARMTWAFSAPERRAGQGSATPPTGSYPTCLPLRPFLGRTACGPSYSSTSRSFPSPQTQAPSPAAPRHYDFGRLRVGLSRA